MVEVVEVVEVVVGLAEGDQGGELFTDWGSFAVNREGALFTPWSPDLRGPPGAILC